jgi:hypothetical protein
MKWFLALLAFCWPGLTSGSDPSDSGCAPTAPSAVRANKLSSRIDLYMRAIRARDYDSAIAMWREADRRSPAEVRSNIGFMRKLGRSVRVSEWKVLSLEFDALNARATMSISGESRQRAFHWERHTDVSRDFWVCENSDWYFVAAGDATWDSGRAQRIDLVKP